MCTFLSPKQFHSVFPRFIIPKALYRAVLWPPQHMPVDLRNACGSIKYLKSLSLFPQNWDSTCDLKHKLCKHCQLVLWSFDEVIPRSIFGGFQDAVNALKYWCKQMHCRTDALAFLAHSWCQVPVFVYCCCCNWLVWFLFWPSFLLVLVTRKLVKDA